MVEARVQEYIENSFNELQMKYEDKTPSQSQPLNSENKRLFDRYSEIESQTDTLSNIVREFSKVLF
jgi:hypothetical protein